MVFISRITEHSGRDQMAMPMRGFLLSKQTDLSVGMVIRQPFPHGAFKGDYEGYVNPGVR